MFGTGRSTRNIHDDATDQAKMVADVASSQVNAVVQWALGRIDLSQLPAVIHGVIITLTGDRKAARNAQRAAAGAVKRATQQLGRAQKRPRGRAVWLVAALVSAALAAAVFAWRRLPVSGEPANKRLEPRSGTAPLPEELAGRMSP